MPSPTRHAELVSASIIGALILCTSATALEAKDAGFFPPEVADSVWWNTLPAGEVPLWQPQALGKNRSRVRLSISGIVRTRIAIRIDERLDGTFIGRSMVISLSSRGRPSSEIIRNFRVSKAEMIKFRMHTTEAKLWSIFPEHWQSNDGNDICIDGEQLVFERVDERGYRFSEMNAQCAAPREAIEAARTLLDVANLSQFHRLLQ